MAETYYAWNPVFDCITKEVDASGATIAEYTHEPKLYGGLISQHRSGVTSVYHYDAIGTTRALTNSSQTVTDTAVYTAFGEKAAATGTTVNPFGYVGAVGYYAGSSSNLIQSQQRSYFTKGARWSSAALVGAATGRSVDVFLKSYVFAENAPVDKMHFAAEERSVEDDKEVFPVVPVPPNADKWDCKKARGQIGGDLLGRLHDYKVSLDTCCKVELRLALRARRCFDPSDPKWFNESEKNDAELAKHFYTEIYIETQIEKAVSGSSCPLFPKSRPTQRVLCQILPGRYLSRLRAREFSPDFKWPDGQGLDYNTLLNEIQLAACQLVIDTPPGVAE